MANLTIADSKTSPRVITFDGDDSRNLAIIYGSLGTLIAFASLIVAVLSWLRSRHQKLATHYRANGDIDLEGNASSHNSTQFRRAERCLRAASVGHNDNRPAILGLAVGNNSQPQPPFELDGISMVSSHHTSAGCSISESTSTCSHPSTIPVTTTSKSVEG